MPVTAAVTAVAGTGYGIYSGERANRKAQNQASQTNALAMQPRSTQYGSSVNPKTGYTYLDPSIRTQRESSLAGIPGYKTQYGAALGNLNSGLGGILSGLQGNQNSFMQARVNPLLQQQAQAQGRLQMSNNLRGLGGSSFADQSMTSQNLDYGRAIGDAGALATQESLGAQTGLQGSLYTANIGNIGQQYGMDQQYASVAGQNLAQELASLGLSQADIGSIMAANTQSQNANQNYLQTVGRGLGGLGNAFGSISQSQQQQDMLTQLQMLQLNGQHSGWTPEQAAAYDGSAY